MTDQAQVIANEVLEQGMRLVLDREVEYLARSYLEMREALLDVLAVAIVSDDDWGPELAARGMAALARAEVALGIEFPEQAA